MRPLRPDQLRSRKSTSRLLGREVAREHRAALLSRDEYPFLDPRARQRLRILRKEWCERLGTAPLCLRAEGTKLVLHTFAGGRINAAIARTLAAELVCRAVPGNFSITFRPGAAGRQRLHLNAVAGLLAEIRR